MKNIDPGGFCGRFFGAIIACMASSTEIFTLKNATYNCNNNFNYIYNYNNNYNFNYITQLQLEVRQPLQLQTQPKQQLRLSFLEKIGLKLNGAKVKDWFSKERRQKMSLPFLFKFIIEERETYPIFKKFKFSLLQ